MKLHVLILLTILLAAFGAAAQDTDFVGFKHKGVVVGETLPNGVRDLGGGLLSDEDYGVSRFVKGKKHYLWLEKITGRDRHGVPSWIVKDVLEFDALEKRQEFLFSYSSTCTVDGGENLDTIVLAEHQPKTKRYKVLKAWKVNLTEEKFEKIPTRGVQCKVEKP